LRKNRATYSPRRVPRRTLPCNNNLGGHRGQRGARGSGTAASSEGMGGIIDGAGGERVDSITRPGRPGLPETAPPARSSGMLRAMRAAAHRREEWRSEDDHGGP